MKFNEDLDPEFRPLEEEEKQKVVDYEVDMEIVRAGAKILLCLVQKAGPERNTLLFKLEGELKDQT